MMYFYLQFQYVLQVVCVLFVMKLIFSLKRKTRLRQKTAVRIIRLNCHLFTRSSICVFMLLIITLSNQPWLRLLRLNNVQPVCDHD